MEHVRAERLEWEQHQTGKCDATCVYDHKEPNSGVTVSEDDLYNDLDDEEMREGIREADEEAARDARAQLFVDVETLKKELALMTTKLADTQKRLEKYDQIFDHIRGSSKVMDEFMAVVREKDVVKNVNQSV